MQVDEHDELLPAGAGHDVTRSTTSFQRPRDQRQAAVAREVAEPVVVGLEVVDVDDQDGHGRAGGGQPLVQAAPVEQPRQLVAHGGGGEGGDEVLALLRQAPLPAPGQEAGAFAGLDVARHDQAEDAADRDREQPGDPDRDGVHRRQGLPPAEGGQHRGQAQRGLADVGAQQGQEEDDDDEGPAEVGPAEGVGGAALDHGQGAGDQRRGGGHDRAVDVGGRVAAQVPRAAAAAR